MKTECRLCALDPGERRYGCPFHNCPHVPRVAVYRPRWRLLLVGVSGWAVVAGIAWALTR